MGPHVVPGPGMYGSHQAMPPMYGPHVAPYGGFAPGPHYGGYPHY